MAVIWWIALAPTATVGACDCGCDMVDCTCTNGDCNCNEKTAVAEVPNAGSSIAALRQQAMMAVPNNTTVPQTGDKGVMACGTIALVSWLILMWLVGAKKKEEI